MNYTKAPWRNNGGQIESEVTRYPDCIICHVGISNSQTAQDTINARLIAAAPELFELCELILGNLESLSAASPDDRYLFDKLIPVIKKTLNKATG